MKVNITLLLTAMALLLLFVGSAFRPIQEGQHVSVDAALPMPVIKLDEQDMLSIELDGEGEVVLTRDGSLPGSASDIWVGTVKAQADHRRVDRMITEPTGPKWYHPLPGLPAAVVVRACCMVVDGQDRILGPVASKTFIVEQKHTLPVISLIMDEGALLDPDSGIYVVGNAMLHADASILRRYEKNQSWWKYPGNYQLRGPEWERQAHLEMIMPDGSRPMEAKAALRINGNNSRGYPIRSLRVDLREAQQVPLFEGSRSHRELVLRSSGNDHDRMVMRDALQHQLCLGMQFDVSQQAPVIVYINGAYWGIHYLRERLDDDELALRYGMPKDRFAILEDAGESYRGDPAQARSFRDQIGSLLAMDPASDHFMQELSETFDLIGFQRYMATQIVLGNTDWPDQNLKYWRWTGTPTDTAGLRDGRWRFMMGDSDLGFGYVGGEDAHQYDMFKHLEKKVGPVAKLFMHAMRSRAFQEGFGIVLNDLIRGPLSAGRMVDELRKLEHQLVPEMDDHIARWRRPISIGVWKDAVSQGLRFAQLRPQATISHWNTFISSTAPAEARSEQRMVLP